jgi:hypothetical protein
MIRLGWPDVVVKRAAMLGTALLTCLGSLPGGRLFGATWDESAVHEALTSIVHTLAATIGPRSYKDPANLNAAADFISQRLESFGYGITAQPYQAGELAVIG